MPASRPCPCASLRCGSDRSPGSRWWPPSHAVVTCPSTRAKGGLRGDRELDRLRVCGQNRLPGLIPAAAKQRDSLRPWVGAIAVAAGPSKPAIERALSFLGVQMFHGRGTQDVVFLGCRQMPVEHSIAAAMAAYIHRHSRGSPGVIQEGQGSRSDRAAAPALTILDGSEPCMRGAGSRSSSQLRAEPAKGRAPQAL